MIELLLIVIICALLFPRAARGCLYMIGLANPQGH
jgi:hypothetical protein